MRRTVEEIIQALRDLHIEEAAVLAELDEARRYEDRTRPTRPNSLVSGGRNTAHSERTIGHVNVPFCRRRQSRRQDRQFSLQQDRRQARTRVKDHEQQGLFCH